MGNTESGPSRIPQTKPDLAKTMKTFFLVLCLVAACSAYYGGFKPDPFKENCYGYCDDHDIWAEDRAKTAEGRARCKAIKNGKVRMKCWSTVHTCRNAKKWADCMRTCNEQFDNFPDCKDYKGYDACKAALKNGLKLN